jgi:hypothetical protein
MMHSGRGVTETPSSRARRRAEAGSGGAVSDDPFALLGLPTRAGLSDDDVRAAWRRIAAATHPDREDGGDPARFGAAAAAYVVLRTGFGRGEALADLGMTEATDHRGRHAYRRTRSAEPPAHGIGRHRARREPRMDRRIRARLPGSTRLRGWITRRAGTRDLPNEASQDLTNATEHVSGETSARVNWRPMGLLLWRRPIRRPGGIALRVTGVAALALVAVMISGWSPGVVGVLAGAFTWLLAAAGRAFSRRRSQRPF